MGAVTGAWRRILALLLLVPITVVSCGRAAAPPPSESAASSAPAAPPVKLSITPSDGAKEAPLSSEVGIELTGGQINEVSLVTAGGKAVSGRMRADGTAWVPDPHATKPNTGYRATVTATAPDGQTTRAETSFTTMAAPSKRTETGLYLMDGQEYGVAMPVVVEFCQPVPELAAPACSGGCSSPPSPRSPGLGAGTPALGPPTTGDRTTGSPAQDRPYAARSAGTRRAARPLRRHRTAGRPRYDRDAGLASRSTTPPRR